MTLAFILLCLAVLCLSLPIIPASPSTAAFVLALIALVLVCVGRHAGWLSL